VARIAFFCPPFWGHLNPMSALASALAARGHVTTVIAQQDAGPRLSAPGVGFCAVGRATHPLGSLAEIERSMGRPGGPLGMRQIIAGVARRTDMLAGEGAMAARGLGVEAVVTDQLEPAGALVAEHLGLPYVSVANALLLNREPDLPPAYTGWQYDPSEWARRRNRGGHRVIDLLMRPVGSVLASWCRRWGLRPKQRIEDCLSPYAEITQTMPGFDFPRSDLPETVHCVGPLRHEERDGGFMLPDTGGRPLVYATLGTLQGGRTALFRTIAEACRRLDLALLVAHGGRMSAEAAASLPGNPIVRDFVPQPAVLRHAALVVSNGGLNTVLDALAGAVPVVAVPIAFEQRAIAARLARAGAGVSVREFGLRPARLARAIEGVMREDGFRRRAAALADEMARAGGVAQAADIVELVVATGRPVTRREPAIP
jgi:zeaxanthin glucosyltransferase